jgi:hypothetical protein
MWHLVISLGGPDNHKVGDLVYSAIGVEEHGQTAVMQWWSVPIWGLCSIQERINMGGRELKTMFGER